MNSDISICMYACLYTLLYKFALVFFYVYVSYPWYGYVKRVMFWSFDPAKNAIQGDAPEGSDTF